MENSKQPIYPCIMQQIGDNDYRLHRDGDAKEHRIPMMGLTKREYYAGLAMQGLCSNPKLFESEQSDYRVNGKYINISQIAKDAIKLSDELLKQLETK